MNKKEKIEMALKKSKSNSWAIRWKTNFPGKDFFDGIVIQFSPEILIMIEIIDFEANGLLIINRKKIVNIRDDEHEMVENSIINKGKVMKNLKGYDWIEKTMNLYDALRKISERKIWPSVEMVGKKEYGFFIGPLTSISKKRFSILCYDSKGNWEKEYSLAMQSIGKIEIGSAYNNNFNFYMKKRPKPSLTSGC